MCEENWEIHDVSAVEAFRKIVVFITFVKMILLEWMDFEKYFERQWELIFDKRTFDNEWKIIC